MTAYVDLRDPRVLRGITKDLLPVVRAAERLGWRARRQGTNGLRLLSPVDDTTIHIPKGRQDPTLPKRLASLVLRHSADETVAEVAASLNAIAEQALATNTRPPDDVLEDITSVGTVIDSAQGAAFGLMPRRSEVVSETPWLAKMSQTKAGGQRYESEGVIERAWDDGTKDYFCRFCRDLGKDEVYTSDQPRSVSAHVRGHTRRGEKKPLDLGGREVVATVPGDTVNHHVEARVLRLQHEILSALMTLGEYPITVGQDPATLAEMLARKIIEHRGERQEPMHEPVPAEPATPEGLLAQIRALIAGDLLTERSALQATIEAQAAALAAADEMVLRARHEAQRYKESLATFADLARDAANEERGE